MQERQVSDEQRAKNWWAAGDTPVRTDSRVTYLVDGRTAILEMCIHFLKAQKYIYLANWGLTASMLMVRGTDHFAGPDGSPEQETLLTALREAGLQDSDIEFWCTHELSVRATLGYAVSKGVEVKALIWKGAPIIAVYSTEESYEELTAEHVDCILDDSSFGILHHPVESLHQKISIVDGTHAFVGGVDLLIESSGDFDRWDTSKHAFNSPLRLNEDGTTPHPWHDAHALIEGPAAADVEYNFRQRWNDVVHHHHLDERRLVREHTVTSPVETSTVVQVARTIPEHTYKFKPLIVQGIAQLYANALYNIERFVYIENQYLWLRVYIGIDVAFLAQDSPEMVQNLRELGNALERGASATLILPDQPNVGRAFSDAGIEALRTKSPDSIEEGRFEAFCLATSHQANNTTHYRPIYVHAKVAIVDDVWATVGSGNLNNRGMRDDTEMNVATLDANLAHGLRLMLQAEHLGLATAEELLALSRLLGKQYQPQAEKDMAQQVQQRLEEMIGDPALAHRMMHNCAWENLRRYKARLPLVGHLLPYFSESEAMEQGLQVNGNHGWIEEKTQ
ncbi:MAG: phospholipase D-like domain-containing protein [Ktedonobacteraceae bacterium]